MGTLRIDLLFCMLFILVTYIVTLIAQVNPPADPVEPPGEMVAMASWPPGAVDVDMWMAGPDGEPVGFSRPKGKVWALLRDDLGTANDPSPTNSEFASTRGLPDGEYVINARCYGCAGKIPVPVTVEVRIVGGPLIYRGVTVLARDKQEKTAIRFRVRDGKVVPGSESHVFKNMKGEG
jgi:hypothetical protein